MESIVTKYATAIVSIAKKENKCSLYKENLLFLLDIFSNNPNIEKFLESYFVSDVEKFSFIDNLTKSFDNKNLCNFLKLLAKKHLFFKFKDIVKEINKLLNDELKIDEGYLYSVEYLTAKQIIMIEEAVGKRLGHKVELKNIIDESLIGGVRVVIHDHVFDGSIKFKIETLKNNLKERRTI